MTGSKTRVTRLPPPISMRETRVQVGPDLELVCRLGPPKGYPQDVRSAQVLEVWHGKSEVTRMAYPEVVAALPVEPTSATNEGLHPGLHAAFVGFLAAVDEAIPYDVQNLANDIGVLAIAQTCRHSNDHSVIMRLSHRTEWSADELILLKMAYPKLDLEATMLRHCYWRARRKQGLWSRHTPPQVLMQYGDQQRWTGTEEEHNENQ